MEELTALVFRGGGMTLRIQATLAHVPLPYTVLGWRVDDLSATMRGLRLRGVEFERFPGASQDAEGIWTARSGEKSAWFRDPDGNLPSPTQP